ncbi:unnamed protein product [Allacma fusca]|uniref:Secreted protein n=1 Tax=Allacma fusca TaxID=39272 RepID=A0A8J2L0A0_9HEXA|nr:unnamed protein product [Allacma fusca]
MFRLLKVLTLLVKLNIIWVDSCGRTRSSPIWLVRKKEPQGNGSSVQKGVSVNCFAAINNAVDLAFKTNVYSPWRVK